MRTRNTTTAQKAKLSAIVPEYNTFLTYVRTLQFSALRLKGEGEMKHVYISQKDIEQRFFKYPQFEKKVALKELVAIGELEIIETSSRTGRKIYKYSALKPGRTDLSLLKKPEPPKNAIYLAMIEKYVFTHNC